jgi:hypothetical protein
MIARISRSLKPGRPVARKTPVKRNRFIQLSGGTTNVNGELEEMARALPAEGLRHGSGADPGKTSVTAERFLDSVTAVSHMADRTKFRS